MGYFFFVSSLLKFCIPFLFYFLRIYGNMTRVAFEPSRAMAQSKSFSGIGMTMVIKFQNVCYLVLNNACKIGVNRKESRSVFSAC